MRNLTIECIQKALESFRIDPNDSYLHSYPHFLDYFKDLSKNDDLKIKDVVIAAHFTYGWMPRILKIESKSLNDVVKIINATRNSGEIDAPELAQLANCFNRSLVGTSKLLHFMRPDCFPIWDSHVLRFMSVGSENTPKINTAKDYLSYTMQIAAFSNSTEYAGFHLKVTEALRKADFTYEAGKIRTLEMILFHAGKSLKQVI